MKMHLFVAATLLLGFSASGFAQPSSPSDGRTDTAPGAIGSAQPTRSSCDGLSGTRKEQCLRQERRRSDAAEDRQLGGSCDAIIGPEKELCLRKGGTIEAGARPSSGATGAPRPRSQ